LEDSSDDEDF